MDRAEKMRKLKGVLFDLDGVIVENMLDFKRISEQIFGEVKFPLLENISQIKDEEEKKRAHFILNAHEQRAANRCQLKEGINQVIKFLDRYNIKKGVITRNSRNSVSVIVHRFNFRFDALISREDAPPKPAKEPVILACKKMNLPPTHVLLLGDYKFDMMAGKKAGVRTVLLRNNSQLSSPYADKTVNCLFDFVEHIKKYL